MGILELKGIDYSYRLGGAPDARKVHALRGVDLSVREGEMLAIRGASGSGKSTLLYVMGCMLRPDRGSVVLEGREVIGPGSGMSGDELALLRNQRLGFIFQQFHLLARASVVENILLPTRYPSESAHSGPRERERAEGLARLVGLEEHLEHLPNQLSGGQQQRVAVARALMNGARILLADEPTGNLDSKSAGQVLDLLEELNAGGCTVVIITHDAAVAERCDRVAHLRDGVFAEIVETGRVHSQRGAAPALVPPPPASGKCAQALGPARWLAVARALAPQALQNLRRNRLRSALTLLGVAIGVSAVLAMMTLGRFTERRILATYEALGVNKINIHGWPNWSRKATDVVPLNFTGFDVDKDIFKLREIFPQIKYASPNLTNWSGTNVTYGGATFSDDVRVSGVGPDYLAINNRALSAGINFSPYHISSRSPVCIVGSDIVKRLFSYTTPIGKMIYLTGGNPDPYSCRVIGVLAPKETNAAWPKPNAQILIPYSAFSMVSSNWWNSQIHEFSLQLESGSDVVRTGKGIKAYFQRKYGKSGEFQPGSDATMVAQMKKFLALFTVMLTSIALISLVVGGMGITNMMLVSVTERFKEIGLRKAVGATDFSIKAQLLLESIQLCALAGFAGLVAGFTAYETLIWGATKFVSKLKFAWVADPAAIVVSLVAILAVGIASGIMPALRAERLQVIEALRSE